MVAGDSTPESNNSNQTSIPLVLYILKRAKCKFICKDSLSSKIFLYLGPTHHPITEYFYKKK